MLNILFSLNNYAICTRRVNFLLYQMNNGSKNLLNEYKTKCQVLWPILTFKALPF